MTILKTRIYTYYTRDRDESRRIHARLKKTNGTCFNTWGGRPHYFYAPDEGLEVWLETNQLFSDQWNTSDDSPNLAGSRVFDWAQDALDANAGLWKGHYLEVTDDMRRIRDETLECGYCGKYEPLSSGKKFCDKCLGSAYLKLDNLHLLRLKPVSFGRLGHRDSLTDRERPAVESAWKLAQLRRLSNVDPESNSKTLKEAMEKSAKEMDTAEIRTGGFRLLDKLGVDLRLVIFFDHLNQFCFGWDQPFPKHLADHLGEMLKAVFPYDYQIKTREGE
jgi:hypothetical protein